MPERTLTKLGSNTHNIFSGHCELPANRFIYTESASLISNAINQNLPKKNKHYTLADFGSHKGDLLREVLHLLPDYRFHTIGVDIAENLDGNDVVGTAIEADLSEYIPLQDDTVDVGMMRYVLIWNDPERQVAILKEITRVTKQFVVLQNAGADDTDPDGWRQNIDVAFDGSIPKIQRSGHFYSSRKEVETWMKDNQIKFECIQFRRIDDVSDVFIERASLDAKESEMLRNMWGDRNYIIQTTWIISK